MKVFKLFLAVICPLATGLAVETRFWQQGDRSDFEKGSLTHLSLRSDGRIFLAPEFPRIFDTTTPYLWTIATDSKGNIYTAGGGSGSGSAKIFEIDRNGKGRSSSELDGLEIHALAIDSKDQLYAATDPDGKVYKISSDGKARTFYDPHQKYIWAMAFNSKGDLFVATGGDQGEIHRVGSNGNGSVFFKTEETHARSLAIDAQDNLIVGTEPSGLILRVSPSGQGFVLYQAPKREITAVAVAKNGSIYAAGVGNKGPNPTPTAAPAQVVTITAGPGANPNQAPIVGNLQNRNILPLVSVAGGSDVYRVNPDGSPRKVWSNTQDVVYALGFDQSGRTLLGTGNRGKIYRLDSDSMSTSLLDATPTQVTGFATSAKGDLYAVTGNIGQVFRIGPGLEKSGTFESEVLDAGSFAYWGRVSYRGTGNISVATRSGNLNHPESNWSPWTPVRPDGTVTLCDSCGGGRAPSPAARFLQYKIELNASAAAPAPDVFFVETAYLTKNVAPIIEALEVASPNYRFPRPSAAVTPSNTLTLPPIGQQKRNSLSDSEGSQTLTYSKGANGVRWQANDENSDTLVYKVEIRGVKESSWQLLKDGLKEKYFSFDTTAFPDGEYVIRVTASDAPSNPKDQALEDSRVSDPFLIDNMPPQISNLAGTASGNNLDVRWTAHDARSDITKAEYSINGGEWVVVDPVNKLSDSPQEDYHLTIERFSPGEQVVAVRVTDEFDNQAVEKVVVK